jgi:hypothetical protein
MLWLFLLKGVHECYCKELSYTVFAPASPLTHATVNCLLCNDTIDSPQSEFPQSEFPQSEFSQSEFPQSEQFLRVTGFCGDGRAVIQPNSFPDTEQVLIVTGFSMPRRVFASRTVDCT